MRGALHVGLAGAGTREFLVDGKGGFHLMEMNPRLQVEHLVTEMVTGIDLVEQQIRVAAGEPLTLCQDDVVERGSAEECRINAEDPDREFAPTPGRIERLALPGGAFVRVDTHAFAGYVVPPHYDSLIAKLVAWGPDRQTAVTRASRGLRGLLVEGPQVKTTAPFAARVLDDPEFRAATHTTDLVELIVVGRPVTTDLATPANSSTSTRGVAMLEQQTGPSPLTVSALNPSALRDVLVREVGLDADELTARPEAALADLGLDSMAQVELGVVLKERYGVGGLPEETAILSFDELAGRLCPSPAA